MTDPLSPPRPVGRGAVTASEIASQPQIWPRAIAVGMAATRLQERLRTGTTLYTGCGSTAHLAATLAVSHCRCLPTFAWAEAASEVWLAPHDAPLRAETVVAVSRSGETTETIEACRRAKRSGATVVAVTTNPSSGLSTVADAAVYVDFASEESVVQTRSFTSMLLAALSAQLSAAGHDVADVLRGVDGLGAALMTQAGPVIERLADPSLEAVYVLGSGFSGGLAREGALKIKEMSGTFCEAFPVLDFRHGPISLVDRRSAALVLCGAGLPYELAVAEDIEACGAYAATVGPDPGCIVETPHEISEYAAAVARTVIPQLAGLRRGIAKGIDPDAPQGVTAYVGLYSEH